MPWNGSGVYSPPAASFPESNGTTIDAVRFDNTINDLATGISAALAKNGENSATNNISMGTHRLTGLSDAIASGDAIANQQATAAWIAGNWGIGAVPVVQLDVQKSQNAATQGRIFNASALAAAFARFAVVSDTAALQLDAFSSGSALANQVWVGNSTANPIIFGIGGAEQIRIDSGGNLLLGVAAVSSLGGNIKQLQLRGLSTTRGGGIRLETSNASQTLAMYMADGVGTLGTVSNHPLAITVNNANVLTIDAAGNLNIPTAGNYGLTGQNGYGFTQQMVSTVGNGGILIKNSVGARVLEILALGSANPGFYGASAGDLSYNANSGRHVFGVADIGKVWINASGLGIGLAAAKTLDITALAPTLRAFAGTGTNSVLWELTNTGGQFFVGRDDSTGAAFSMGAYGSAMWAGGAGNMGFFTNAVERMRISVNPGEVLLAANTAHVAHDGGGAAWGSALPIGTLITGSRQGAGTAVLSGATVAFTGVNFVQTTNPDGTTTNVQYGTWRALGNVNATFGLWVRTA